MIIPVKHIMKVAGLTYRQVQYWDDKIIKSNKRIAVNGKNQYRDFSEFDLTLYKAISSLKSLGISLQEIQKRYLSDLLNLTSHPLFIFGGKIIKIEERLFAIRGDIAAKYGDIQPIQIVSSQEIRDSIESIVS